MASSALHGGFERFDRASRALVHPQRVAPIGQGDRQRDQASQVVHVLEYLVWPEDVAAGEFVEVLAFVRPGRPLEVPRQDLGGPELERPTQPSKGKAVGAAQDVWLL